MDNPIQKSNIIFVGCALPDLIYKIQKNGPCSHKIPLQMCHTTAQPSQPENPPWMKTELVKYKKILY